MTDDLIADLGQIVGRTQKAFASRSSPTQGEIQKLEATAAGWQSILDDSTRFVLSVLEDFNDMVGRVNAMQDEARALPKNPSDEQVRAWSEKHRGISEELLATREKRLDEAVAAHNERGKAAKEFRAYFEQRKNAMPLVAIGNRPSAEYRVREGLAVADAALQLMDMREASKGGK